MTTKGTWADDVAKRLPSMVVLSVGQILADAPEFEMNEAGLPVGLRVALGVLRRRLGG